MIPATKYFCLFGLFLPFIILFFNKGYSNSNKFLAGFLFFSSVYVLENFFFFYGEDTFWVALFTIPHSVLYLIGPFSYFYIRSILRDNDKLSMLDLLHFTFFTLSFLGIIPYIFTSWETKLTIAKNLQSDQWDLSKFKHNKIIPHKIDQILSVLLIITYSFSHWILLWKFKITRLSKIVNTPQFNLIRIWLIIFASIFLVIAINFLVAMSSVLINDNKNVFLERTSGALFFASLVYLAIHVSLLCFPRIMYGLPFESVLIGGVGSFRADNKSSLNEFTNQSEVLKFEYLENSFKKAIPKFFSFQYVGRIEEILSNFISKQTYLISDFSLSYISEQSNIPSHHLSYYFNNIKSVAFIDWRNNLRIEHAIEMIGNGFTKLNTLESLATNCGFSSQNTFIRCFKQETGLTPSEYISKRD